MTEENLGKNESILIPLIIPVVLLIGVIVLGSLRVFEPLVSNTVPPGTRADPDFKKYAADMAFRGALLGALLACITSVTATSFTFWAHRQKMSAEAERFEREGARINHSLGEEARRLERQLSVTSQVAILNLFLGNKEHSNEIVQFVQSILDKDYEAMEDHLRNNVSLLFLGALRPDVREQLTKAVAIKNIDQVTESFAAFLRPQETRL